MNNLVINVGLPRTGTSSVRAAMERLGYVCPMNPHSDEYQRSAKNGDIEAFVQTVLANAHHRKVFISEPAYGFDHLALKARFPEAIMVATWRSTDEWSRSVRNWMKNKRAHASIIGQARVDQSALRQLYAYFVSGGVMPDLRNVIARQQMECVENIQCLHIVEGIDDYARWATLCHAVDELDQFDRVRRLAFPHRSKGDYDA